MTGHSHRSTRPRSSSVGLRRFAAAVGCAFSGLAWVAPPAGAQRIEGNLVDRDTGSGIPGAFVMAVDTAGIARAGSLTDDAGRFHIALPSAGSYALSVQRIGYRSTTSEPIEVSPGQTRTHRMEVPTEAVVLADLEVSAERRCTLVESAGVTLSRIWDEARKAMLVAEWTRETGAVEMEIEEFQRTLDPRTLEVTGENRTAREYYGNRPYRSLPPEELAQRGYVAQQDDGTYYYAPDETVLLSGTFLDAHCFSPLRDPDRPGLIGLGFEPLGETSKPDIRGAFWLHEQTAELRFVEYRYSRLLEPVSAPEAGGRVEFERLGNGAWIVSSWFVRMPRLVMVPDPQTSRRVAVLSYLEEGGDVVRWVDAAEVRARTRAVVEGRVLERDGGAPLVGAVVFLSGTQYRTVTDAEGRFRLADLPVGTFPLVYRHERLEEAGTFARPVEVRLVAGEAVWVTLFFPPDEGRQ